MAFQTGITALFLLSFFTKKIILCVELLKAVVKFFTKQNKAVFKSQNRLDLIGRFLVHILVALFATFA